MSLESYAFDITLKKWVRSFNDPSDADIPIFGHGDSRDFGITFLRRVTTRTVQVVESTVGAVIVLTDPATIATVLCQATAGSAINNEYPFVLNISSANLTTFMTSQTTPKLCSAQIKLSTSNGPNRYDVPLYIAPTRAADTAVDSAAPDRALGYEESAGIYVAKMVPQGLRMIWTDEATGQKYSVGFANGQFLAELL